MLARFHQKADKSCRKEKSVNSDIFKLVEYCDYEETADHTFDNGICTLCGAEQTEEHTHTYGEPEFKWSEDMKTCKAVFTCTDSDGTITVNCTVTKETTKDATCTETGEITYTATCTFNGETYES